MSFKLSFNCHFISITFMPLLNQCYALYYLHVVCVAPLHFNHSMQMLFHSTPLLLQLVNKIDAIPRDFVQFPSPFLLFPFHLFTPTPLSYQHTLQPFSFSLDVFYCLPPNHTNQNAASITQIIVSFATTIITSTFAQNCHSFSHFDSTSTPPIY